MNILFIYDVVDALSESICVSVTNQKEVKFILESKENEFPMICCEYTPDSDIEVLPDESKFLNDESHDGTWIIGSDYDEDDKTYFVINFKSEKHTLEIDTFEISKNLRGKGYGAKALDLIESIAEDYYDKIVVSPFDTDAMNFWEHRGYVEDKYGNLVKDFNCEY